MDLQKSDMTALARIVKLLPAKMIVPHAKKENMACEVMKQHTSSAGENIVEHP